MKMYSTKKRIPKKVAASALTPLLLIGLASAGPAAANPMAKTDGFGSVTGIGESCSAKLRCEVGRSLYYDYSATFVSDAEVQTAQEHGFGSAQITGRTQVELTALENRESQCTYVVSLTNTDIRELVQGEVVQSSRGDDVTASLGESFFFTQSADGRLLDVTVGGDDLPEAATFKRGIVNALNVTIQDSPSYEVMETDISGTHLARYSLSESKGTSVFTRELEKGGENLLKGGVDGFNYSAQQDTQITIDQASCLVAGVEINEQVVIAEPTAADPGVSEQFRHETLTVNALAVMQLLEIGAPTSSVAPPTKARLADMVKIPVNAAISESPESVRGGERAQELLFQLREDSDNDQLLNELARLLRDDAEALAVFSRFTAREFASGDLAHSLGSLAIGVGSPKAQSTLASLLLSATLDESTRERLIGLSVLIERPTPGLIKAVSMLAQDTHLSSGISANLALGAYAYRLADSRPMMTSGIVEGLSQELATAGTNMANVYLRALGNAGSARSLEQVATFLHSADRIQRLSAVVALRKVDSPRVDELLIEQMTLEDSKSVQQAIRRVFTERVEKGLSEETPLTKTIIIDWEWSETYGGNFLNATIGASTLVDSMPYEVDIQANAVVDGSWFDPGQVLNVQLLTEPAGGDDRRFRFFVNLVGFDIANIDETETCSIEGSSSVWNESIKLAGISTPPIPIIGPLTLKLTFELKVAFSINWVRQGDWCTSDSSLQLGMTPSVGLVADGYATLSLFVVRGGIGIAGTLVAIELPVYAQADMNFQNASDVCFVIDAVLKAGEIKIYAWGQVRIPFLGWRPRNRAKFTIWKYTLFKKTWNLVQECEANPDLQCLPDVLWWDDEFIDAIYDGANCFVATPPAGSTPFIADNSYYLTVDSECPDGMPYDGTGCVESTIYTDPGVTVSLWPVIGENVVRLTFYRGDDVFFLPLCPSGWTQTHSEFNYRTCERTPPAGYSISDFFFDRVEDYLYKVYIDGSGSCIDGILNSTGCYLGMAPGSTEAFLSNGGNFYYHEP